ncbi:hypothetical protein [Pandoraea sputorum]|uniref:hypothetical protein n=1 Tax=Pandoraea sputorum TaxID=93222 RepID=UPI001240C065|nr:hypothetical protein [Pandoraea sputorum]VVE55402.1 hypothetical protein PSP20601_04984 [Pandoraea sputorum]
MSQRFIGFPDRPAERLTISIAGVAPESPIDLQDIANDQSLRHEARGEAVLKRIAEHIVPALLLSCVDLMVAHAAALQIATQLGDAEFATLGLSAVQRAMDRGRVGRPLNTTHLALGVTAKYGYISAHGWQHM